MSLLFYAYFHLSYLFIIIGSILFNFLISKLLLCEKCRKYCKIILFLGITVDLAVIFYYKYFNFFLTGVNAAFGSDIKLRSILMPLGISFFTFQQISYLADSYHGETKSYGFIDYALFVTFFPQLVAGPIVFHQEMIPQFQDPDRKKFNQDRLAAGLYLIAAGLAKKVLIADTLGKGADYGYASLNSLGGFDVFIVSLLYTFQLYFDFSGYCDMAIGIASCFNINLPVNFNSPYKSLSVVDFWKRWHITLNRFLQKYVYFPLGGSRKGYIRTLVNVMIVFLISGIWHGAAMTFVLWGVIHGVLNVLYRIFHRQWDALPAFIRWLLNFLIINMTWIFFRANSISDALKAFKIMFSPWTFKLDSGLLEQFDILEFTYIEEHVFSLSNFVSTHAAIHLIIILTVAMAIAFIPKNCHEKPFRPTMINALSTICLIVWSVISFSGLSTFLYFNF
jgi:D-alanyl-lipoteichoic acid acyltransferase DltB (MBOAT superfamily)